MSGVGTTNNTTTLTLQALRAELSCLEFSISRMLSSRGSWRHGFDPVDRMSSMLARKVELEEEIQRLEAGV